MNLQHILSGIAVGFATLSVSLPANAALQTLLSAPTGIEGVMPFAMQSDGRFELAKGGRGRGGDDARGRDDDQSGRGRGRDDDDRSARERNDDNGNFSGSGRRKPRIPGGSGCDDPGDTLEHSECSP